MDIIGLIPSFGNIAWTLAAFIVALSIIVAVHEYGHYIVGRWCGIHAEVFSLGFGPVLWSRTDRRGTTWQVAALPLGGYVKFLGDADAASGRDGGAIGAMGTAERRRTMHGAPLWARAATVAAGPAFNFAMAILVFAGVFWAGGIVTDRPVVGQLRALPFEGAALRPGDRILAIGGIETPDTAALGAALDTLDPAAVVPYRVERDGTAITVDGPFPLPPLVDVVQPRSAAGDAGLRAGDVVLAVDGAPIVAFRELRDRVGASGGQPLTLTVWRAGETFEVTLRPKRMDMPRPEGGFETRWLLGLNGGMAFDPETRTPGPLEGLWMGAQQTWAIIATSLSALGHIVSGAISPCNLQGPIGMAETSGESAAAGPEQFIWFIAMLSTAVGLMNLFPVPVLDGGHLVFHAYEAVTRRPPSDRALRVLMSAGFALLIGLMVFALTNDLFCP